MGVHQWRGDDAVTGAEPSHRCGGKVGSALRAPVEPRGLGRVRAEKALCQFPRTNYDPDVVFSGSAKSQGILPSTLLHPIANFIVEVLSPPTSAVDRGVKFDDYAAHGVGEYWIVDPEAETVEQILLQEVRYSESPRRRDGLLHSEVIPGFAVPMRALLDDEASLNALRTVLAGT